ncbi:MAG TPA: RNA polymerase sigma factor [Kineosporiaceae bacterium]|nr:RNA polymerase sigma factor [Kineosporiaceae bacterium]
MTELGDRFPSVLEAAVGGDQQAFELLWRSTHPMLVRYLRVLYGQSAEDIASEAWVRAIHGLNTFHGDEHGFRGWLVVIARNHARDLGRRAGRRPEILSPDLTSETNRSESDTADVVLERLSTHAALRLVSTLPPSQAEMIALRVIIGLDVAQVAEIVGRSPGAVRVAVHRGLRTLAGQLTRPAQSGPAEPDVTQSEGEALSRRDV